MLIFKLIKTQSKKLKNTNDRRALVLLKQFTKTNKEFRKTSDTKSTDITVLLRDKTRKQFGSSINFLIIQLIVN